ncbi:MAG: hypothetical protein HY700_17020 [Gemmatimonadetes bacterium]|nr:hypothetical protein [Gemmatimonadota bacterium]
MSHKSLETINPWLNLAANVAVVASIVFLALQLRQTTTALRASTYLETSRAAEDWQKYLADSDHLAPAITRYLSSPFESLSSEDRWRLQTIGLAAMYRMDALYFQYESGLLDDEYVSTGFKRLMEIWVPRWKDMGVLESGLQELRPSFRAMVAPYRDLPLQQGEGGSGKRARK